MTNCFTCKWYQLQQSASERKRMGIAASEVDGHCAECVKEFAAHCRAHTQTCINCAWKDRNLPYEKRRLHCKACAEAFASVEGRQCSSCPWNNPKRPMPTDAAMEHCKICLSLVDGKAMNCETCRWKDTPKDVRVRHCSACSLKFAANSKVVSSTNELSNKGQVIESYDNHNANMTDDRDTVPKLRQDYVYARKSTSSPGSEHPVFTVSDRCGMTVEEFAQNAYEKTKLFLYELSELTDLQALLFLSTVRGETKTDFAKRHGITCAAVNSLYKQIIFRSEIFKQYIILSRGSLRSGLGRKAKDPNAVMKVPKTSKKIVYSGIFQMDFAI